jgi:hypothetical protein
MTASLDGDIMTMIIENKHVDLLEEFKESPRDKS